MIRDIFSGVVWVEEMPGNTREEAICHHRKSKDMA